MLRTHWRWWGRCGPIVHLLGGVWVVRAAACIVYTPEARQTDEFGRLVAEAIYWGRRYTLVPSHVTGCRDHNSVRMAGRPEDAMTLSSSNSSRAGLLPNMKPGLQPAIGWFCAICLLGAALRFSGLGVHSLWFDEVMTVWLAQSEDLLRLLADDRNPPLAFWTLRAWIGCFGESDQVLRALPATVSSCNLCLAVWSLRSLLPGRIALVTTVLLAVSPYSVWYGQEIRTYYLVELGSTLAVLGLLRFLLARPSMTANWLMVSVGCLLCVGANYTGGYIVFAAVAAAVVMRVRIGWKPALAAASAAVVGVAAWTPWFASILPKQLANGWGAPPTPDIQTVIELPARLVLIEPDALPAALSWIPYAILVLIASGLLMCALRALKGEPLAIASTAMFLAMMLGPLGLLLFTKAPFGPRYLMAAELPLLLMLGVGLATGRRRVDLVLTAVTVAMLVAVTLSHRRENLKEDYRHACAEVARNWRHGDRVASLTGTFDGFAESPIHHYLRHRQDIITSLIPQSQLMKLPESTGRLHLVFREAPYSWPLLAKVRQTCTVVDEQPMRLRVQYLLLEKR